MNNDGDNWWLHAACRGQDPEMFFTGERDPRAARKICDGCLVRAECLQDVLKDETSDRRFGVRAGLTPQERNKLVKGRRQRQLVQI
jgi:WhiB family transcriptional regulator, redox-sensing transcriptional regulator